ncbi:Sugar-specific transcriptional regulator TrmB [Halorubrum vacuolatum]|uniref:Sugar-specific transcriptional regulator TrmB n=2 Tax=Halorubrum vacuolatum TaxID=63740 RepID=A0A238X6N6_HALVU|nr:Sugar-specific transcriptional regulator TrmB [Halorubrum vacuolatum]
MDKMLRMETAPATRPLPPELQSPRAKLVYLYLTTNGEATVGELADDLGMKKIALYGVLKTLRQQNLVDAEKETYTPLT